MPIIQSVERALRILDLFDEHAAELKMTDISHMLGLHKSTLHSLLKTLQAQGYIDQNHENGKYRLGMKLAERGHLVLNSMDIRQKARGYLRELSIKTGQTTHLGVLDGKEGVYIDKVDGKMAVISYSRIGRRLPVHSTAIGKVLLSFLAEAELNELLKGYEYTVQTPWTIVREAPFLTELAGVRSRGYAIDNQENEQGVKCVSVPVWNVEHRVVAAMSISTIISRINDDEFEEYITLLKQAGLALSRQLGFKG